MKKSLTLEEIREVLERVCSPDLTVKRSYCDGFAKCCCAKEGKSCLECLLAEFQKKMEGK